MITETKVTLEDQEFYLKVDTNEDPTKKGIKVQFIPTSYNQISPDKTDDIAIELLNKLDNGLQKFGMKVERDRQLKDKTIIGFFIHIEYLDKIIRAALTKNKPPQDDIQSINK
jgi:hypothetical protein